MRRSEILPLPTASWIGWCIPLTGSSCKENRCAKNEVAKRQRNEKNEESCGNGGAVESVESQKQASPSFHSPLEISPKAGEIPTFPQLRRLRRGKVENQKQVSHFPTAFSLFENRTEKRRASPPALRGAASRLPRRALTANNDECSS